MKITFTVDGIPEPKRRPRFARRDRRVVTYTTRDDKRHENRIARAYITAAGKLPPTTGAITLTVEAIFTHPKSWSRRKRETMLHKTSRPDIDNLAKSVLDGLNGVAYVDDAQIIRLITGKIFGERNETVISIERI